MSISKKYYKPPYIVFNSTYLEALPDDVFFAVRYEMSEEDKAILEENSTVIHGRKFYRSKVRNPILEKYAALTNPKEGEPGSRSNPLIRFGKKYIYNSRGYLIEVAAQEDTKTVKSSMLTEEQVAMVRNAARAPIIYGSDCPKSTHERLERFSRFGSARNKARASELAKAYFSQVQGL